MSAMIELTKAIIQPDCQVLASWSHRVCFPTHNANAYGAQPEWITGDVAKGKLLAWRVTTAHLHLLQRRRVRSATEAGHELLIACAKGGKRVTGERIEDGRASNGVVMRANALRGARVDEDENVAETVVVNVLLLLAVRGVGERPVVAGSDRRSAGLCRTKLRRRAGIA